jgi:hypothetical protein
MSQNCACFAEKAVRFGQNGQIALCIELLTL